jgi:murein DD-endopeptidase MepM/ murein hydrolase activator NlpD
MLEPQRLLVMQLAAFLGFSLAYLTPTPTRGAEPSWLTPLVGSSLVNNYRQSETPYSSGHRGVDYRVKLGQGVFAPDSGTVHFSGWVVNRPVLSISHRGEVLSSFEPVCSFLSAGEKVIRGDLIGEVCEADNSYLVHCESLCLHFSARRNGNYFSPLWLTGELAPSVLLPWDGSDQALG